MQCSGCGNLQRKVFGVRRMKENYAGRAKLCAYSIGIKGCYLPFRPAGSKRWWHAPQADCGWWGGTRQMQTRQMGEDMCIFGSHVLANYRFIGKFGTDLTAFRVTMPCSIGRKGRGSGMWQVVKLFYFIPYEKPHSPQGTIF